MKGIILAGGLGTRLYPLTLSTCKQLLPIYDKPMIYYPLSVLLQAGIRDILIIATPHDLPRFQELFQDGSFLGVKISYAAQERPEGIAQAFLIAESFIDNSPVALILGDNLFYGNTLAPLVRSAATLTQGATIFAYEVKDPERYGVVTFDPYGRPLDIVEKPTSFLSPFAVTGLYFYDHQVVSIAKSLKPSLRGEYEITDINRAYLAQGNLQVRLFDRGFAWLDTGTPAALHQASQYVQTIQERQGISIACLEEIAYDLGLITQEALKKRIASLGNNAYSDYLLAQVQNRLSDGAQAGRGINDASLSIEGKHCSL